jgi:hypothetical protein
MPDIAVVLFAALAGARRFSKTGTAEDSRGSSTFRLKPKQRERIQAAAIKQS